MGIAAFVLHLPPAGSSWAVWLVGRVAVGAGTVAVTVVPAAVAGRTVGGAGVAAAGAAGGAMHAPISKVSNKVKAMRY